MKYSKNLICSFGLLLILTSCIETVVIGGVATGALLARDKTLVDTKDDIWINSKIIKEFAVKDLQGSENSIDVIVNEGRVLLTGVAKDSKDAKKAADLCWNIAGVKEVIDEIQVIKNRSFGDKFTNYTSDAAITIQVETRLLFLKNISSLNYKTTTFNGVTYIIGVGRNNFEIKKVVDLASKINGVKKVVSHVILENDDRRKS